MDKKPSIKSRAERRHDSKVRELERVFTRRGLFCQTFIPYLEDGVAGEIDLFVIKDSLPPVYKFYEIKCHGNAKKKRKAREQYERFLNTYNLKKTDVLGYIASYDRGIKRL
jgi:hypothetical protein